MNLKDAVVKILNKSKEPLSAKEITISIISKGLWKTNGKTPERTVGAQLYVDIKKKGNNSRFVKAEGSVFGLKGQHDSFQANSSNKKTLSFTEAAVQLLKDSDNKQPMHYREITELALKKNLLNTVGRTPEATMYAQIISEIRRQKKRGEISRFIQHGKGFVGLSSWLGHGLVFEINEHNKQVQKKLHTQLLAMTPEEFEKLVGELLVEMGFEDVEITNLHNDGGIDARGTLIVGDAIKIKMAVQAKRWKAGNNIQAPTIQQVRGSLGTHDQGLIITTSDFSKGATKEAARLDAVPVALINGSQLTSLLIDYSIRVNKMSYDILELNK